jgi:hypothetical protein
LAVTSITRRRARNKRRRRTSNVPGSAAALAEAHRILFTSQHPLPASAKARTPVPLVSPIKIEEEQAARHTAQAVKRKDLIPKYQSVEDKRARRKKEIRR